VQRQVANIRRGRENQPVKTLEAAVGHVIPGVIALQKRHVRQFWHGRRFARHQGHVVALGLQMQGYFAADQAGAADYQYVHFSLPYCLKIALLC